MVSSSKTTPPDAMASGADLRGRLPERGILAGPSCVMSPRSDGSRRELSVDETHLGLFRSRLGGLGVGGAPGRGRLDQVGDGVPETHCEVMVNRRMAQAGWRQWLARWSVF